MLNESWTRSTCLFIIYLLIPSRISGFAIQKTEVEDNKIQETFTKDESPKHTGNIYSLNYTAVSFTAESSFKEPRYRGRGSIFDNFSCAACNTAVWSAQAVITMEEHGLYSNESAFALISKTILAGCKEGLNHDVCDGIVQEFMPQIYYILKNTNLGAKNTCSFVMSGDCAYVPNPSREWTVMFPPVPKPPILPRTSPKNPPKTLKVLQLSDLHYDPFYQAGSNANCGNPLCCRSINGPAPSPSDAAGKWGDYRNCDTPKITIDHLYHHIQTTHPDIDYILWTGDLPPHDVWNQTRSGNLQILRSTMASLKSTFPNTTIFPALGNHESAPVNSFPTGSAPSQFSISWLYSELHDQWQHWLPPATSTTVKLGAFYSVLVKPGFRIISVNTNYCNDKNFWLLINSTDPANELQWLIDELQGAENRSEKVHIIGHIPPGTSDCLKIWSANYYRIINRYESTIAAQFFGHTHFDEFELFYDTDYLTRPVSVAYVGPSVSPYEDLNPGYRIYYVDDEEASRLVVDHETWIMNLEEANLRDSPEWEKLYSARDAYQMASLLPADWNALIDRMIDEPSTFSLYYKHYHKDSPVRPLCDTNCRKKLLCDLRNGRSRDREIFCQSLEERINGLSGFNWNSLFFLG